jgi:imidazolonepropionase-like amidohydrolase
MRRIALALTLALAAPATAETVAISAAGMVDVASGKRVDRPLVIVTDGRISAVGAQGSLAVPAGAKRIDLGNKTLLPGLIDMHVHLTSLAEIGGYNGFKYTDSFWSAVSVGNARKNDRRRFHDRAQRGC